MTSCERRYEIHRRLPLPIELINIINDYIFMNKINYNSKKRKDVIMQLISNTNWCGRAMFNIEHYIFFIKEDEKSPQFQQTFCKKCGNYSDYYTNSPIAIEGRYDGVICKCV
jgi:hypothetical protein